MTSILQGLFSLFIALSSSLPSRVLSALGIGWLTYTGLSAVLANLISATFTRWNAIPASIYQLLSLAGFTDAVGIITAAMVTRVTIAALPRLGKLS
jgi:hypothetical protein